MRGFFLMALAACFLALAPAQTRAEGEGPAWQVQRFADLGFAADFPGAVERKEAPIATSTGSIATTVVFAKVDGVVYFASVSDVTGMFPADADLKAVAGQVMSGMLKNRTPSSGPTAITTGAGPAWDAISTDADTVVHSRAFVSKTHAYSVMVIAPAAQAARVSDPAAERYLDSLRLF